MGDRLGTPSAVSKIFFFNFFFKISFAFLSQIFFFVVLFLDVFLRVLNCCVICRVFGLSRSSFCSGAQKCVPSRFGRRFFFPLQLAFWWRNVSLALRLIRHLPFVDCKQYLCKIRYSNKAIQSFLPSGLIYNVFTEIFSFLYSTSHLLSFWNFRPKK